MKGFSVRERLALVSNLPKSGSLETIKILEGMKKKIEFNPKEWIEFGMEVGNICTCNDCKEEFLKSDKNIDPKLGAHKCPKCNSELFTESPIQHINWNTEAERDAEIDFTVKEKGLITKTLEQMNAEERVTADHISLFEKFSLDC